MSYQQKLSQHYIIYYFFAIDFPQLPHEDAGEKFVNSVQLYLNQEKQDALDALSVTQTVAIDIEKKTVTQIASTLWQMLWTKRITALI